MVMSLITTLTRSWLTRSARPIVFLNEYDGRLSYANCDKLGLYVHIPFCRSICNFCPYCKVKYDSLLCDTYIDHLLKEIRMVGSMYTEKKQVTSLYFGGGTPALAADRIGEIIDALQEYFEITEGIGVELHPDNVTMSVLQTLKDQYKMPIYGTFLDGKNMYETELTSNGVIVMGNEGNGVTPEIDNLSDHRLYIPNYPVGVPTSESLNVSVATAIVCAEFRRR